jgi:flagellar protein FliS
MSPSIRDEYLVNQVMTATPQRLQLMLIEAAIRFCERARQLWLDQQFDPAGEAILRSQEIVTAILAGLQKEKDPALVRKVSAIYNFIFRSLVTAFVERNERKLGEAISVLEIERETWTKLCEELGTTFTPVAAHLKTPMPGFHATHEQSAGDLPTSGFSLEA